MRSSESSGGAEFAADPDLQSFRVTQVVVPAGGVSGFAQISEVLALAPEVWVTFTGKREKQRLVFDWEFDYVVPKRRLHSPRFRRYSNQRFTRDERVLAFDNERRDQMFDLFATTRNGQYNWPYGGGRPHLRSVLGFYFDLQSEDDMRRFRSAFGMLGQKLRARLPAKFARGKFAVPIERLCAESVREAYFQVCELLVKLWDEWQDFNYRISVLDLSRALAAIARPPALKIATITDACLDFWLSPQGRARDETCPICVTCSYLTPRAATSSARGFDLASEMKLPGAQIWYIITSCDKVSAREDGVYMTDNIRSGVFTVWITKYVDDLGEVNLAGAHHQMNVLAMSEREGVRGWIITELEKFFEGHASWNSTLSWEHPHFEISTQRTSCFPLRDRLGTPINVELNYISARFVLTTASLVNAIWRYGTHTNPQYRAHRLLDMPQPVSYLAEIASDGSRTAVYLAECRSVFLACAHDLSLPPPLLDELKNFARRSEEEISVAAITRLMPLLAQRLESWTPLNAIEAEFLKRGLIPITSRVAALPFNTEGSYIMPV
jgi:hypothetical protein